MNNITELLLRDLKRGINDLISTAKRGNIIYEIKDKLNKEKILSLDDVIYLYQKYLTDCFREFYIEKEKLEKKISSDTDQLVSFRLYLERERYKTVDGVLEEYHDVTYGIDNVFLVIRIYDEEFTILKDKYSLQGDKIDSYFGDKDRLIASYYHMNILKYKEQIQRLAFLYYNSVSSILDFDDLKASETKRSSAVINFSPAYHYKEMPVKDDKGILLPGIKCKSYYSDNKPINFTIKNHQYSILRLKNICDEFTFHMTSEYFLTFMELYTFDKKMISIDNAYQYSSFFDTISNNVFPDFKIHTKDLPDFLQKYMKLFLKGYIEVDTEDDEKEEVLEIKDTSDDDSKELQIVNEIKKQIEDNNLKIVNLIKNNQNLYQILGERQKISKEVLCMMVKDEEIGHWVIRPEFRDDLAYYDLSDISFDNVEVKEIDFINTNIRGINFNPQTVYHKDLSGCYFDSSIEENLTGRLFDYSTDFTGVNLEGTTIKQPITLYNTSIVAATVNSHTDLPVELWRIRNMYLSKIKRK